MNLFSWPAETWFSFFQWASVLAAVLTFVSLTGAVISGRKVNQRQTDRVLTLERELESERIVRLAMEHSIAPRSLVSSSDAIRMLQRFAGTPYILEFIPDAETERLATQIGFTLSLADWKQESAVRHFDTPIRDGIAVEADLIDGKLSDAARDLAEYFQANALEVWTPSKEPFRVDEIPKGTVRIRVGFKPNPYFEAKSAKDTRETKKMLDSLQTPGLQRRDMTKEQVDQLQRKWHLPAKAQN